MLPVRALGLGDLARVGPVRAAVSCAIRRATVILRRDRRVAAPENGMVLADPIHAGQVARALDLPTGDGERQRGRQPTTG